MDVIQSSKVTDLNYVQYLERQWHEVSSQATHRRAGEVKPAGQFKLQANNWIPNSYEGFAIVSMVENNSLATGLADQLSDLQTELKESLIDEAYYFLPQESFHQTIANTLSDRRFVKNIVESGVEPTFPGLIQNAFKNVNAATGRAPVVMKLIGLGIFGNAIGILGIMEDEKDYDRILAFRSGFYANEALSALDVQMTRPFIGHITLAYIERELTNAEKQSLSAVVNGLNQSIAKIDLRFKIERTELRRYHHLAEFIREDHYPVFYFNR